MTHHFPLRAVGAATAAFGLTLATACGDGGSGGGEGDDEVLTIWTVQDEVLDPVLEASIEEFNETSDVELQLESIVNDAYKEQIHVAIDSDEAPDVFFSWGGGNLGQYVDAGLVRDMTEDLDEHPEFRDAFVDSVMDIAAFDGSQYGVPMKGTQPVSFFYNMEVFEEHDVDVPETYDELMDAIDTFQEGDVTPVVLPGAATWTNLMWFSYLTDRIGGAEVYEAISMGEEGAWEDPAIIETAEEVQRLVDEGAFGDTYASLDWDGGEATTVLAEGQGAMILMGPWMQQDAQANAPDFFESGNLGYFPFPGMEEGEGDPSNVVGPPTNYFSIHSQSEHPEVAMEWMAQTLTSDEYVDEMIANLAVPPIEGIEDKLTDTDDESAAEFNTWLYDLTQNAETFTPAWDQDLDPAVAEEMLTNFGVLWDDSMTPEEFAEAMEAASQ